MTKETRVSFSGNVDHRLGDSTTETSAAQITDRPSSHIKEAAKSSQMHMVRIDKARKGQIFYASHLSLPEEVETPGDVRRSGGGAKWSGQASDRGQLPPTRPMSRSR